MVATEDEMMSARLDLQWRDYCAHVLIPLNKCRRENHFLPFRCVDERHAYEKCQWTQFSRRTKEMTSLLREERVAASEARDRAEIDAARKAVADQK